jgi:hypothetical protein
MIRHTSDMLRQVVLIGAEDYPVVLKHLRDHCPKLRSLTITAHLFMSFPRSYSVLHSILERLERFEVIQHYRHPKLHGVDLATNIEQLLRVSDEPLNLKHLFLELPWTNQCSTFPFSPTGPGLSQSASHL